MIGRKRDRFSFSAVLLLCSLPWALPWIDECSTQEFIEDSESSFQVQACSVDELELRLDLINTADFLGKLVCSDKEKRVLTHYRTLNPGLTDIKFAIDPPLVESSHCNVILCYEDSYYDLYYIHSSPSLQYSDCVNIEASLNHSALFFNFVTVAELSYSSDVISVPSVVTTTTPDYNPSTPITGSSLPISASVLAQNLQITHITESNKPTAHSIVTDSHSTQLTSNSNLASSSVMSSLTQTSIYITSSQIKSTNSTTNTNYLTSPVIKEPELPGPIGSDNLILIVSIPLSVTCLVAMATVLFCIFRIAFQHSCKRKLTDSQANSSSSFHKDSKEHFELSSSPSICTIISPLSSMDDSESISKTLVEQPSAYGACFNSVDTYSDSYILNDSTKPISAASFNSIVSKCTDPVILPSCSDVSNSGDNVSFSVESISLCSLEELPEKFLPYEERRQAVDLQNTAKKWERESYIYIVDNYEII